MDEIPASRAPEVRGGPGPSQIRACSPPTLSSLPWQSHATPARKAPPAPGPASVPQPLTGPPGASTRPSSFLLLHLREQGPLRGLCRALRDPRCRTPMKRVPGPLAAHLLGAAEQGGPPGPEVPGGSPVPTSATLLLRDPSPVPPLRSTCPPHPMSLEQVLRRSKGYSSQPSLPKTDKGRRREAWGAGSGSLINTHGVKRTQQATSLSVQRL